MKPSLLTKLDDLNERFEELGRLLSDPAVIDDQNKFREYSQEYARLQPLSEHYQRYQVVLKSLENAQEMLEESDREMQELAEEELKELGAEQTQLEEILLGLLVPPDPLDDANLFLEIRAGTGGDEAAIFAGDLHRMYSRYAEAQGWQMEIINQNEGEHGGYKEIISRVIGRNVYGKLKFESGAHRVQRVPETESQGRIHTSACTVAVLPEPSEIENVEINPADIRVDTFRASGAGGQHVNKTDSAVRITHTPTGVVVECQDERSQHKNRARALSLLNARLVNAKRDQQIAEQTENRRQLVGSGDRSERIRTYNYPQGRVTDHRINLTLYKLDEIMQGAIDQLVDPLIQEHNADQLAELAG